MHIGMQSYAAAAHLAARVYNEQQVRCIFRFSLRSRTSKTAATAGSSDCGDGTGGAGEAWAPISNCALLSAGDRRGGWEWRGFAPPTTLRALFGPGDDRNCSFIENLGTAGCWASGRTEGKNKGFTTRPSSGGRSHLLKSSPNHFRVPRPRASCSWLCRPSWRGPGRAGDPAYDWLHGAAWVEAVAAARERGQSQGVALGDEQAEVLPVAEWMQQRTAGAGCG